jgi:HAD superfamily hydrolase (TIGR01509 family)
VSAPQGVVFDCDGLLLDTEECWTRAESALFSRYGREFGPEDKRALLGTSPESGGRIMARTLDQPGRALELAAELYELILAEVREGAAPLRGASELVSALDGRPKAVASNSPRELLLTALERGGLVDRFDAIVGADEVDEPKPAPDLYLRACELLGVAPADAVALEDSPPGVAAARAAGLFVIGVPSLPDVVLEADLVVESLLDPAVWSTLGLKDGPDAPARPAP